MDALDMLIVILCGALGGLINSLLTENGFTYPSTVQLENGKKRWEPGVYGIIILGIAASVIFFGFVGSPALPMWKKIATALLAGIGGGSIITTFMQQQQLQLKHTKMEAYKELSERAMSVINDRIESD